MYFYFVGQLVKDTNSIYKVHKAKVMRYESTQPLQSVITQYRILNRLTNEAPFIVAKCALTTDVASDANLSMLSGDFTIKDLKQYSSIFKTGLLVEGLNATTNDQVEAMFGDELRVKGSTISWTLDV